MIPDIKILDFKLDYIDGVPGVKRGDDTIFTLDKSELFHGLPLIITKEKGFLGFNRSREFGLFRTVRDALRNHWRVKNNYDYVQACIKLARTNVKTERTRLKTRIKWAKDEGKSTDELQAELDLISTDPEDFVKARRAYYGMNNAALLFTNKVLKHCLSTVDPKILTLVRRFPKDHRPAIYKMAKEHEHLRQFIEAYPVLGLVIASSPSALIPHHNRNVAKQAIIDGLKIKEICAIADFPISFRKVKPQSAGFFLRYQEELIRFDRASPNVFRHLIPQKSMQQYRWMTLLCEYCNRLGPGPGTQEQWMNWLANVTLTQKGFKKFVDLPIHSLKQELGLFFDAFMAEPWGPHISFDGAMKRQVEWHEQEQVRQERLREQWRHENEERRLQLKIEKSKPFPDPFLPGYAKDDWEIVPLQNVSELEDEGLAMHHCVGRYAHTVRAGNSYIYSVRHNGNRVATLELGSYNQIMQLRSHCNQDPGSEVFKLVRSWINNMVALKGLEDEIAKREAERVAV